MSRPTITKKRIFGGGKSGGRVETRLNQCSLVTGPLATVDLTAFTDTSVPWQIREDGTVLAYERRGWTDYPFPVLPGEEGVYEVRITGGAEGGSVRGVENLPGCEQIAEKLRKQ